VGYLVHTLGGPYVVYLESRVWKEGKKEKKKKPGTFGGPNQWDKNATTFV